VEEDVETRLNREARGLADSYFKRHIIKCGDSYYWSSYPFSTGGGYMQKESKNEPEFDGLVNGGGYIQPRQLTRAEELNKVDPQPVEWQGTFSWRINTARVIARGYNDWKDTLYENVTVIRRKGHWYVGVGLADPTPISSQSEYMRSTPSVYIKVTCGDFVKAKTEAGAKD